MRAPRFRLAIPLIVILALLLWGILTAPHVRSVEGNDFRYSVIAVWTQLTQTRPNTADDVAVSPRVANPLGVNTFLEQEVEPEKRTRALRLARDAGFHWIRQQFRWEEIEPLRKGEYVVPRFGGSSWAKYDDIVDRANQMGLEVIARLDTSPAWARPDNPHAATPPSDPADYADFVAEVVSRYRGRVRYYQIWNEPNLSVEWGNQPVDPEGFARLLRLAYQRAKAVDPSAVILAPALAPTTSESDEALNELTFLQRLYDLGAGRSFDIASTQAYGLRAGPDDRRTGPDDVNFSRPLLFREVMVRNGDAAKSIWISELGWNVPPRGSSGPYIYGQVNEDQQARYTVRGIDRARTEWPWAGVLNVWYLKRADDHDAQTLQAGFRLLDPDFTPRPVYDAIKDYARQRGLIAPG